MDKVYLVVQIGWDHYVVEKIFKSEEHANKYCNTTHRPDRKNPGWWLDKNGYTIGIEEYDVEDDCQC